MQNQSFADVPQTRCSYKIRKFHRKAPVLEPIFNKVVDLKACNFIKKRLQHSCFPVKYAIFLGTFFLQNTSSGCFWKWVKDECFLKTDEYNLIFIIFVLQCYSIMKARYMNSIFIAQLKDIASYGKNQLKRDNITLSTEIIGKFIVDKNRSEIETGELTKLLKESLSNIEEELKCLKEELNTVFTMFNGCATGSVNCTVLFLVAQTFDEFYSKRCGNGISLKYERYSVNSVIMKIQRRRKECVRNSDASQKLACSLWLNNNTVIEIAEQMAMVTLADANSFVSQC